MESVASAKSTPVNLLEQQSRVLNALQQAVSKALARHKALGQAVAVADAHGAVRLLHVEALEREASQLGSASSYDL